jgi:D-amino-acid oxidase
METRKLETEAGEEIKIIHNYGHGGSGITSSFGCANEVARMVLEHTKKK